MFSPARVREKIPGLMACAALCVPAFLSLGGCELTEVTLAEVESVLVAEVYVMVGDGDDQLMAFLQGTLGSGQETNLRDASVRLILDDGGVTVLQLRTREACLLPEIPTEVRGTCFVASPFAGSPEPGSVVKVEIDTPGGLALRGTTTVPKAFGFHQPRTPGSCFLPPSTPLEVRWGRSRGAWAYAAETQIWGLKDAMAARGIEVEEDTVALLGLAVSDADTTLVFPGEFGVFDRFELDRNLALAFQEGLPLGTTAHVVVAALDRNYVNWVRGGNFNPSGAVRVPSLRGDGTGVLAAVYRRSFGVRAVPYDPALPACVVN